MLSRSLLFVPADKEKMLMKVNELQADIVILDLEDAISLSHKQIARDLVREYTPSFKKSIIIRVNSLDTAEYSLDMRLIAEISESSSFKGIMLPKADSRKTIDLVANDLRKIERDTGIEKKLAIFPIIESALGVKNAYEIAGADERIKQLAFGGVDFITDIGAQATVNEQELLYARSEIIIASRSAGLDKPIDTVFVNFKDSDRFHSNCSFVKSLGFGGKLLIHPAQVDITNKVFSPSEDEVKEAKEIVNNLEENEHVGVFQLHGKMIDKPVIEQAKRILSDYEQIIHNSKEG